MNEPTKLASAYCQKMMGFLLFHPCPAQVLMIGLGGGLIAKFCHRQLPVSHVTAVEIDTDVIALRSHFCIPPDDGRPRVVNQDGAVYVEELVRDAKRVDVILVDAFDQNGMARSVRHQHNRGSPAPPGTYTYRPNASPTDRYTRGRKTL